MNFGITVSGMRSHFIIGALTKRVVEMKKTSYLIIGLLVAPAILNNPFGFFVNAQRTTTLIPVEDTYVSSAKGETNSNFGGKSYLQVANSANMFTGECLGFLKFDMADIPSNTTIHSAKLELQTSLYVTSTHTIEVHYCPDNFWTELTITYQNCPSFTSVATDSAMVASTGEWYEWDVTSDVLTAIGDDKKLTLVLSSDYHEDADWVWFHSRDQEYSWMEKYRPKLVVSYEAEGEQIDLTSGITTFVGAIILTAIVFGIALGGYKLSRRTRGGQEAKPAHIHGPEEAECMHNLLVKYRRRYPHNPEGVLEFHISKRMKEGKTREQAIKELVSESG